MPATTFARAAALAALAATLMLCGGSPGLGHGLDGTTTPESAAALLRRRALDKLEAITLMRAGAGAGAGRPHASATPSVLAAAAARRRNPRLIGATIKASAGHAHGWAARLDEHHDATPAPDAAKGIGQRARACLRAPAVAPLGPARRPASLAITMAMATRQRPRLEPPACASFSVFVWGKLTQWVTSPASVAGQCARRW